VISLLKRNSLDVTGTFTAEKFALNLSERQSTATITIGPEAPAITVGDWLRDESDPGAGIVWRVKSIDTDYATNTRTINCDHMIQYLRGRIMFGEVTPVTITGDKKATKCTAAQAITYILKQQSIWKLKKCEISQSEAYSFNGDDLYSALETVSSSLENEEWKYDFTSYPFQLTIAKQETDWDAELRMDRNIRTLKKTIDMSRMYTRFYPIGKNNLKLKDKYVAKNDGTYGAICKVETNNELDTEAKLKSWAKSRLKHHAEPVVTVTISGLDMSAATGLSMDKLTIGKKCRVPLPEFGTTITERITKLSWSDKIADPESVTVTLANEYEDVASIINSLQKTVSSGGKGAAKNAEEDHAWIVDTTEKVELVAEAVGGKDKNGNPDWSMVSRLTVDGKGIQATVTETKKGLETAQSSIKQTSTSISQVVKAVGSNGKVTAASIVTAINNDKSSIKLKADHILISGTTKLNDVITVANKLAVMKGTIVFGEKDGETASISKGIVKANSFVAHTGLKSHILTFDIMEKMIKKCELSSNTLKLELFDGTKINFSRAITSWDFGWSNGTLTVTVQPGSQKTPSADKRTLITGTVSRSGTTISIPIRAQYGSSGQYTESTGWSASVNVANVFNSMSMTRALAGKTAMGVEQYYGRLYYYDGESGTYKQAYSADRYWYYSTTNRSGTTNAYY